MFKNNLFSFVIIFILIIVIIRLLYSLNEKNQKQNQNQNQNNSKKLNILHIGKTAGRAINDSIKNEPNIKLARHQVLGQDFLNCECGIAAVIRDPKDRLVSAISWFRQGGEKGEMFNHPCHKFVKGKKISEILRNTKEFQQKCLFNRNTAFIPTTHYLNKVEDRVIPICFNKLQEDYDKKIKPYKLNNIELKTRNKSKRPPLSELSNEDHEALDNFVNNFFKKDLEYYNKTCL